MGSIHRCQPGNVRFLKASDVGSIHRCQPGNLGFLQGGLANRLDGAWQLSKAGILRQSVALGRGVRTQLHSDGNRTWPKMVQVFKKPSVQRFHVNHSKHEFLNLQEAERAKVPRQPQQARVPKESEEELQACSERHPVCGQVLAVGG